MKGQCLAVIGCILALSWSGRAHAEEPTFEAGGRGVAGGALLGAETTLLAETALGVKSGWAYAFGFVAGAGAGAALGYWAEEAAQPEVSEALLISGLVLILPTAVWLGRAHQARPPESARARRPEDAARDRRRAFVAPSSARTVSVQWNVLSF